MHISGSSRAIAPALLIVGLTTAPIPASSSPVHAALTHATPRYLTSLTGFHTVMSRNFNPFTTTTAMDFTAGAIYEPLTIITPAGGGHTYPWLATGYAWKDNARTLLITVRHGVRWSDGVPFTANDVLFTYTYGKINPIADQISLLNHDPIASVNLVGSDQVAVHFTRSDTPDLPTLLANIKILPEHIWSKIKNPDTYTNPDPVGTGPFTQVQDFSGQGFVLGKNPYYWQPGKPAYDGLRLPAYTGNDSASLSMVHGDLDWTPNFVPNIDRVYVQRDPAHFHYYYDTHQPPNDLFFNNEKYPFSLVGFRKAISYAIDRNRIYRVAEYGYEPPADAIGLSAEYPTWVDKSLSAQATDLATYQPNKAKALLASLGFTLKGGQLHDPKGNPVSIQLTVPSSYSDWILAMQIMQKNFQALGIDTSIKLMEETSYFDKVNKGLASAELYWTNSGFSPYDYFYGFMSKDSYVPTGQDASVRGESNYERWWSPAATTLLKQFQSTTDVATQHTIVNKLQKIQLDNLPAIPVMVAALWYTYSTLHFTGWPTPTNSYAFGQPAVYPDNVKVMTTITPAS